MASFLKMWSDIAQRDIGRGHDMRLYLQRSTKPVSIISISKIEITLNMFVLFFQKYKLNATADICVGN